VGWSGLAVAEIFTFSPPDDEYGALAVTSAGDRCTVCCTWSYEGASVDLDRDTARTLGLALIGWADGR